MTNTTVRKVLATVCTAATAARTTAEREETRIYTHYEGWLPDDDDLPTTAWLRTWCERGHGFLQNARPRAALTFQLPLSHAAPNPQFDPNDPEVLTRTRQRHNEVSSISVFESPPPRRKARWLGEGNPDKGPTLR